MNLILAILLSTQLMAQSSEENDFQRARENAVAISTQIDQALKALEPSRHALVWSQGLVGIISAYPFVDFYLVENRLRRMNARTYLIAAPISTAPADLCSRSLTGIPAGDLDFYLWIGVNGPEEAAQQLASYGMSAEQNLENLKRTGLLVQKPLSH